MAVKLLNYEKSNQIKNKILRNYEIMRNNALFQKQKIVESALNLPSTNQIHHCLEGSLLTWE